LVSINLSLFSPKLPFLPFPPPSGSSGSSVGVFFGDGHKVKVHMDSSDTTSDLLDKEEVKKHLTSSAAHISLIDSLGNG